MGKDTAIGALIFLGAIAVGVTYIYGILNFFALTIGIIVTLGMAFVLFIAAWLGVEMMRTPSLEDFEEETEKEKKPAKRKRKK